MRSIAYLILILSLTSCFKSKPSNPFYDSIEVKKDKLHLIFSHNINGETHPCGCRHFPLGGLPQVAGKLNELKSSGEVYLLDTGDLLFPSPNLPPTMKDSFTFGAKNLSDGMDKLGLKYFVPGDQDLALGIDFLKVLLKGSQYKLLVSNLVNPNLLPHKRIVIFEKGKSKVFMIGMVDPSITTSKMSGHFTAPSLAMPVLLEELKKIGFDQKNKKHRLVLLSHSGMPNDQNLVKKFPQIDWVLGAHTQSFTKIPYEEGTTKLAQVLSRNHYLGEVQVELNEEKSKDTWVLHEIRDELKEKLSPNPFEAFINNHKDEMKKIQIQEQSTQGLGDNAGVKLNTAASCIECHQPQVDFWHDTSHSIAYATLINDNEEKNLTCIGCHSVGFQSNNGFMIPDELIVLDKEDKKEEQLKKIKEKYWAEVSEAFKDVGSIRKLPVKRIRKLSKDWLKRDERNNVTHNFANVQCLNCHDTLHQEHPFAIPPEISEQAKYEKMKENCLNCHIPDRSPEWYETLENGKAGRPKEEYVRQKIKELSCPKRE
ncbi:MAG: hypothetical protein CME70_10805 [Halobacteriovorax sp.]|nr:hypothetical protein [Halobacteriovorax sp.]|tara:strand:+ start:64499 stop:66115 length:1617 start_codon:yes stop_codon:yes gene_type:complete